MSPKILIGVWVAGTILLNLLAFIQQRRQNPGANYSLEEAVAIAGAVMGFLSGMQVLWQTCNLFDDLHKLLNIEGIAAVLVGAGASMWLAIQEISKRLFPKRVGVMSQASKAP